MSRLDLHIHTSASDGTLSPQQLIREVIDTGIDVFAVSDHDSTDNLAETSMLSLDKNLNFIPAAEISSFYNGKVFHILCYGSDFFNKHLQDVLYYNQSVWKQIDIARIDWISKREKSASLEEFENYSYDCIRGGWPSLNYLIDKGIISDMYQYFSLHADFCMDRTFTPLEEVIKAINISGGLAFLAHPAYSKDKNDEHMSNNLLNDLLKCGIKGIECYNIYNNSKKEEQFYVSFAKEKNLFISGGSDYHGEFIKERKIGNPYITDKMIGYKWYEDYIIKD